jgi:DNA-binding Lrp family transcriptional regulator
MALDAVDLAILRALLERPRVGVREYARSLGLARATVQSRIDRMEESGALISFAPQISLAALGFPVLAVVQVHLRQGSLDTVVQRLQALPYILSAHSTTGDADLVCQVVARDHADLEAAIQEIVAIEGVVRTHSDIALRERVPMRLLPLLQLISKDAKASPRASVRPSPS